MHACKCLKFTSNLVPFSLPWNVVYPLCWLLKRLHLRLSIGKPSDEFNYFLQKNFLFLLVNLNCHTILQWNLLNVRAERPVGSSTFSFSITLFTIVLFMPCDSSLTFNTVRKALKASSIEQKKRKVLSETWHRPPRSTAFTHSVDSALVLLWLSSALLSFMIARMSSSLYGCDDLNFALKWI